MVKAAETLDKLGSLGCYIGGDRRCKQEDKTRLQRMNTRKDTTFSPKESPPHLTQKEVKKKGQSSYSMHGADEFVKEL